MTLHFKRHFKRQFKRQGIPPARALKKVGIITARSASLKDKVK